MAEDRELQQIVSDVESVVALENQNAEGDEEQQQQEQERGQPPHHGSSSARGGRSEDFDSSNRNNQNDSNKKGSGSRGKDAAEDGSAPAGHIADNQRIDDGPAVMNHPEHVEDGLRNPGQQDQQDEPPPFPLPEPYGANLSEFPLQHMAATQHPPVYLMHQQHPQPLVGQALPLAPQPPPPPPPPAPLESHPALAMAHYYESRMRDHAAAYANAAAGAAWAAAQIAAAAAEFATTSAATSSASVPVHPPPYGQPPPAGNPILVYGPLPPTLHVADPSSQPYYAPPVAATNAWSQPPLATPGSTMAVYGGGPHALQPAQPFFCHPAEEVIGYQNPSPLGAPTYTQPEHFPPNGRLGRSGRNSRRRSNPNKQVQPQHYQLSSGRQKKRQQHFHSDGDSSSVSVPRRVTVSSARVGEGDATRRRTRPNDDNGTDADSKWSSDGSSFVRGLSSPSAFQDPAPRAEKSPTDPAAQGPGAPGAVSTRTTRHDPTIRERNRRREDDDLSSSTTTTTATAKAASQPRRKKKLRGDGDDAVLLLGRTGVAALYEWCSKRFKVPTIRLEKEGDEFVCTVELDGDELGKGIGRNKASAKQVAARRAVQAVVPGVRFDPVTCVVTEVVAAMPERVRVSESAGDHVEENKAMSSLDDLAPNLAKRLAIGHDVEDGPSSAGNNAVVHRLSQSSAHKRLLNIYPGTSTTSEDDDENHYSASRDASVCSALLHTMVQIDGRIQEPPTFQFELRPIPPPSATSHSPSPGSAPALDEGVVEGRRTQSNHRAPKPIIDSAVSTNEAGGPTIRGIFTCTATLRIYDQPAPRTTTSESDDGNDERKPAAFEVLSACGSGPTKKESRQMAAAQLLALLFPDCSTMLEVKAAAEAAREAYAASRTTNKLLLGSSRGGAGARGRQHRAIRRALGTLPSIVRFATSTSANDPPLPEPLRSDVEQLLGVKPDGVGGARSDPSLSQEFGSTALRMMSRQRQLDSKVELALQTVNELDDEGRCLPSELTENDIGRTVLRRAVPGDWSRMKRLLAIPTNSGGSATSKATASPLLASQLWSSSCIVLLLCRAIAAYEDPPLGCAVLTLGFCMDAGPLLCVAQLASEHHLPKERFVECLQGFARAMKCTLRVADGSRPTTAGRAEDEVSEHHLRTILSRRLQPEIRGAPLPPPPPSHEQRPSRLSQGLEVDDDDDDGCPMKRISSPLQSVLEESEVSDSSSVEKRPPTKRSTKPSKRSRFA